MIRAALAQAGVAPGRHRLRRGARHRHRAGRPDRGAGAGRRARRRAGAHDQPLLVGSVKTNIGHLEAAAGVAGLIKAVLALQHGRSRRTCTFRRPTRTFPGPTAGDHPDADLAAGRAGGPRLAGVSAFGLSGTNAHVVLGEASARRPAAGG